MYLHTRTGIGLAEMKKKHLQMPDCVAAMLKDALKSLGALL